MKWSRKMCKIFRKYSYLLFLLAFGVQAETGLVNVASRYDVNETADRFISAVEQEGLKIFARIDHAAGAAEVGKALRPTQLVIFGSPKVGTALISSDQRVGIDLPLKMLVWRDKEGQVWLSYNNPDHLFGRFGIENRKPVKEKMTQVLKKLVTQAAE
jgi:uncharacterized protein (DUF302 family)